MDDRRFGVEIECGTERGLGVGRTADALRSAGFQDWDNVDYDGSEIEVHSPILQGRDGIEELKAVMHFLRTECGAYVTSEDGMHVHHDAPEFLDNGELQVRLVKSWFANIDKIYPMVDPIRHGNGWCHPWRKETVAQLERSIKERGPIGFNSGNTFGGDFDLTLRNLPVHGTIEIRLHEGCLDGDKAEDWIVFGQNFIRGVLERKLPIRTCSSVENLLKRVKVPKKHRDKLVAIEHEVNENSLKAIVEDDYYDDYDYGDDYDLDW